MIIIYYSPFKRIAWLAAQTHLGKFSADDICLLQKNFICWGKDRNGNNVCSLTYHRQHQQLYKYALQGIGTLFNINIVCIDVDEGLYRNKQLKMWHIIIVAWNVPIFYDRCIKLVMNNLQSIIV